MAPPPGMARISSDQGDDEYKDFLRLIATPDEEIAEPKLMGTSETDGAGPAERRVSFATLTSSVLESVLESDTSVSTPHQNGDSKPVNDIESSILVPMARSKDSHSMSRRSSKTSTSSNSEPTSITHESKSGQSHDSPWSRRSSTMSMTGVWDKLQARKSGVWDEMSDIDDDEFDKLDDNSKTVRNKIKQSYRWLKATMHTAITSRRVIIPCLLLFVAWVVIGCLIIFAFTNATTQARKERAVSIAEDTDQFFVRILENAFVPLFTIAQFVYEIDLFTEFDLVVGDRCNDTVPTDSCTSAPNMMGELNGTHRNLTDLFNTEYGNATLEKFNNIAAGIKENSGLGKSLAAIQLAPKAVVSLIYPMINCEDFTDGYCLNNTGAWGHDLLNDPARTAIASKTVPADGVVTAGPVPLIQGGETFIARLPINMNLEDGHRMVVDDVEYPCWGFAIVLLDWATLKKDSNIYEEFKSEEMQFMLTRTDVDKDTGEEKVVFIAQSDQPELIVSDNVTLALHTGDNGWVISVGYNDGFAPAYGGWVGLVFLSAVVFTLLMMLVLTSKKEHERLLGNLMPLRAINKLRKGETVVERYQMVTSKSLIFFKDDLPRAELISTSFTSFDWQYFSLTLLDTRI
jgi:sensor domain CHASE-containing protein